MSTGTWFAPLLRLRWHWCSYNGVVIFHYPPPKRKGESADPGTECAYRGPNGRSRAGKTPVEGMFMQPTLSRVAGAGEICRSDPVRTAGRGPGGPGGRSPGVL